MTEQVTQLFAEFYECALDGEVHVKIRVDEKTVIDEVSTERRKLQFPQAWRAFLGDGDALDGQHRLETQAWIDPLAVPEFKAASIHTVEQLAGANDGILQTIDLPDVSGLQEKAKAFVKEKQAAAGYDEVKAENEAMREEMEAMRAELASMRTPSSDDAAAESHEWPQLNSDGEWTDSSGAVYDEALHSPYRGAQPNVTKAGVFRKRRAA